ncbi:MAG: M20/M25/M40 family metallo-hydrolase [Desulfobacterales bacterium]|nr:M20/M25/M40 family metallo-hydrolase [Desulfobacterales bacterium]
MISVHPSDVDRILDEAIRVQQIPAPTFQEKQRSDYVCQRFVKSGLARVTQDRLFNVYGRIPGQGAPPVVVSAHLDTVFDLQTDLTIKQEPQRIHGPGIGDNSLSVAVLICLKQIVDRFPEQPRGDIILVANAREEGLGNLAGIKAVVERLASEHPKAYLVLEGADQDRLYIRGVGSQRFKVTATTKGGHSWSDFGQPNAIHHLARVAAALADLTLPESPKTTLNIGMIQGGRSVNTIAESASLLLDLRSVDEQRLKTLVNEVVHRIDTFACDGVHLSREDMGSRPAGEIDPDAPLIRLCKRICADHGITDLKLKAGSTDANIPFSKHIPAVCLGLTYGENAHLESEFIETEPLGTGISILVQLLEQIWKI